MTEVAFVFAWYLLGAAILLAPLMFLALKSQQEDSALGTPLGQKASDGTDSRSMIKRRPWAVAAAFYGCIAALVLGVMLAFTA